MDYEELLNEAYEKVKPCEFSDRFEIKPVAGHFEGLKTVITNFGQIAICLRRNQDDVSKFLCKELASQCEIDRDRIIFIRRIPSKTINEKIKLYAKKFVICKSCGKPDTEIVNEDNKKFIKCLACGAKNVVS